MPPVRRLAQCMTEPASHPPDHAASGTRTGRRPPGRATRGHCSRPSCPGRGLSWIADTRPGRDVIGADGMTLVVGLDNLGRELTGDAAPAERVASFTGQVMATALPGPVSAAGLYWLLEPNDYQAPAAFRAPVSPRLDRVLGHVDDDGALIRWITPQHLGADGPAEDHAAGHAWSNLGRALRQAQVTTPDVDGVALGMLASSFREPPPRR